MLGIVPRHESIDFYHKSNAYCYDTRNMLRGGSTPGVAKSGLRCMYVWTSTIYIFYVKAYHLRTHFPIIHESDQSVTQKTSVQDKNEYATSGDVIVDTFEDVIRNGMRMQIYCYSLTS